MTRPRHLLRPAQLFPEKKYPMRESLLPVGLELAEAFTGNQPAEVHPAQKALAEAEKLSGSYRCLGFLLDRAGAQRTLSGNDTQNALTARSWLGGCAHQRAAGANYPGSHVDVARGLLHESHRVRASFATGRAKAHWRHPFCLRCIRGGGRDCSGGILNSFLPARVAQSPESS